MSSKNSKSVTLGKIAEEEISEFFRGEDENFLKCNTCPLVTNTKIFSYQFAVDPNLFSQSLEDIRENPLALSISRKIINVLAQKRNDEYDVPDINPLEEIGMHITSNPGFSYH